METPDLHTDSVEPVPVRSRWIQRVLANVLDRTALLAVQWIGLRSRYVTTSVGAVHALVARGKGELPPIVLVHGLSSCATDYEPLMRRLRVHCRAVYAIDLPWHGNTRTNEQEPTAEVFRTAVAEAMDVLLDEPALVYGNSLGGFSAVRLAQDRPEAVLGLVLASPAGAPMTSVEISDVLQAFRMTNHRQALRFMDRIMNRKTWLHPIMAQTVLGRLARPWMKQLVDTLASQKMLTPDEVASLATPTLVMWGDGERLLPATGREFFRAHLGLSGQVEETPGVGHVPFADRPNLVARRVVAFLRDVCSAEERPCMDSPGQNP